MTIEEEMGLARCDRCGAWLTRAHFPAVGRGVCADCRDVKRTMRRVGESQQRYWRDPERWRAYHRDRYRARKERAA